MSRVFSEAIAPDPRLTVSDWADRNRVLSTVESAIPGQWRTDRTPYLQEIMDALCPWSPYRKVVFEKASQIGGSEVGINWLMSIVDQWASPTLIVLPTDNVAKKYSRQRIEKAVQNTPSVRAKIGSAPNDPSSKILQKEFPGGILFIIGAQSAAELKSMPIKNVLLEEIDEYKQDLQGQGDVIKLAEARTRNFMQHKLFLVSTPTEEKKSRIDREFKKTDQRHYHVPCPLCGHYQTIEWAQIQWNKDDPTDVWMECISCKGRIEERSKTKMLAAGKWIAKNTKAPKHLAGFFMSSLYSPLGWYSWAQIVEQFLEAKDNQDLFKVFVNTVLGQVWKTKGEAPNHFRLFERRETYEFNKAPKGVCFITAGCDVQRDRFEIEVVGWGRGKESWSIDYRVIPANTNDPQEWAKLDGILGEFWKVEGTSTMLPLTGMAVDTGYNTQVAYMWCRNKSPKVSAIKGQEKLPSVIGRPKHMDFHFQGKLYKRGLMLWAVGTSELKGELYGWLHLDRPNYGQSKPGYCHFPMYEEDYFKGLTAEELKSVTRNGRTKMAWEKVRERNEPLDTRIYARASAAIHGIDRLRDEQWDALEAEIYRNPEKTGDVETKKPENPPKRRRPKSDFW